MRRTLCLVGALAALVANGCTPESALPDVTGKGTVRAINAISTSPQLAFLIEERVIGTMNYRGSTIAAQYDDLVYNFNIEAFLPGDVMPQRIATRSLAVVKDKDYTFVVIGSIAAPTIMVWEGDLRTFDVADTVFQARFGHLGATQAAMDVYFAAPGVTPMLGQQIGTVAFGEVLPAADYAAGDYVLIYTAANDPAIIMFTSDTLALAAQTALTYNVFDGGPNETAPLAVRQFNVAGQSFRLNDANFPPTLRFIHASAALATADIYDDPALLAPIVTVHAFGDVTADIPALAGVNSLTYTTAGDTAAILFQNDPVLTVGNHHDYYVVGTVGALSAVLVIPDRRSVESFVKFTIMQAATNHPLVDIYIVEADVGIVDTLPIFVGVPDAVTPVATNLVAGSFDLYLTSNDGLQTVIAGPFRLDVAAGDIVNLLVLDAVDPATADIFFVPQP